MLGTVTIAAADMGVIWMIKAKHSASDIVH
jgi:hypothetical protein